MRLSLLACVMAIVGCRDSSMPVTPADLSHVIDGAMDLSASSYTAATVHDIDTNAGSAFPANTKVKLTGVVAVTAVNDFFSRTTTTCRYEIWVQDPTCTTAPCGLGVQLNGMNLGVMDAGVSSCPFASDSNTDLATVHQGDTLDISGTLDVFTDTGSAHVKEHVLVADSITASSTPATITPTTLTDGSIFVSKTGTGWNMYEGMYVTIAPNGGLTVSTIDSATPFHFHTNPGATDWGTTFRFLYKLDGGDYPTIGIHLTSISGVVTNTFGGAVEPTKLADFAP